MSDWTDEPLTTTVNKLGHVPLALREAIKAGPTDRSAHATHFDGLPVFRQIEIGGPAPKRAGVEGPAKVLFWNVERLRHLDAITAALLAQYGDVLMLCEIDRGMARSGNTDRVNELAARLGSSYAYGVEFLELDLGDLNEKRIHAGEHNQEGLHGAAILTDATLHKPFLIRIDRRGDWFDGTRHEPRVGGTIAIGAQIRVAGMLVTVVNTHLESHGDPAERAADMLRLLTMIDSLDPKAPVVLGGDFNTSTVSRAERFNDRAAWLARLDAEPMRLLRPQQYEPLFELAQRFGYDCSRCNVADAPTTRYPANSERRPAKIDWFFTRGCEAFDPQIIPAILTDGSPASDHEGLAVTIRPLEQDGF